MARDWRAPVELQQLAVAPGCANRRSLRLIKRQRHVPAQPILDLADRDKFQAAEPYPAQLGADVLVEEVAAAAK